MNAPFTPSRRQVLQAAAVAGGGLSLGWRFSGAKASVPGALSAFVIIDANGAIRITAHQPEIGQGVRTSFPMMIAEELDVDWKQVTVVPAPGDRSVYGVQLAGGSSATPTQFERMRRLGAAARYMLVQAAAKEWGVPAGEITTGSAMLHHAASGRSARYADLAEKAAWITPPDVKTLALKDPSQFKILGTRIGGVDNRAIVTGKPLFGIDTRLPGMVYAAFAKSPVFCGKLKSANRAAALAVPGVKGLINIAERRDLKTEIDVGLPGIEKLPEGIAVLATSTWAAMKGRDALACVWEGGDAAFQSSTAWEAAAKKAHAEGPQKPGYMNHGNAPAKLATAAKKVSAEYSYPFISHAQLEPINATAHVKGDKAELWLSTQTPEDARRMVALALGLKVEDVTIHMMRSGGGFGRRLMNDFAVEAAVIAKAAGVPVKLQWDRGQDFAHDWLRPGGWHKLEAGLDADGNIIAWHDHFVSFGKDGKLNPTAVIDGSLFPSGVIKDFRADVTVLPIESTLGWLRAPINNAFAFVTQGFIDDCAIAAGREPLEYRRAVLGTPRAIPIAEEFSGETGEDMKGTPYNTGRMRGVLDKVAEMAGWGRKLPPRRGMGIAFHFSHLGYFANVVEASVANDGSVTVHHVWVAADIGKHIVNLSGAENQVQGSVIDALGAALGQRITFADGAVEQKNYGDYPLARMDMAPPVEVAFLSTDYPTTGLGEPAYPSVAPALAGAIYQATGKRLRSLPLDTSLLTV
ncbi:xanthine dehydrogenase family protein molybdopterin-binding subunit [Sandarakinorhabdus oryzae]|uniref:xanthine dehydrogenase family protein molybdopterin-binding subunit n=1 Tax=Sandarakinorhabdus oryzae TaxID=2675220 RepID=UPI0012E170AD|nr:molybdopterin cofactor-binding domain-containing protein [Sandarakinorhabdus oryzae]